MPDVYYHRVSASRLKSFLACPRSYYFQYHEQAKQPPATPAKLGQAMHTALCQAALHGAPDKLGTYFDQECVSQNLRDLQAVADGHKMIPWLATILESGKVMTWQEEPLLEIPFALQCWERDGVGIELTGIIDRVDAGVVPRVIDWKTGYARYSRDQLAWDPQALIYWHAAKELLEVEQVQVSFALARYKQFLTISPAPEEALPALNFLADMAHQLVTAELALEASDHDPSVVAMFFGEEVNRGCTYCARQGQCDTYAGALLEQPDAYLPEDLGDLAAAYDYYSAREKLFKDLKGRAGAMLKDEVEAGSKVSVADAEGSYYSVNHFSTSSTEVDEAVRQNICTDEERAKLDQLRVWQLGKIGEWLDSLPEDRQQALEGLLNKLPATDSSLRVTKLKKAPAQAKGS